MNEDDGSLTVSDALASCAPIIGGIPIPAPVKKGFFSAVSRLAGAAIDIPVAKLESYAEEIRAATDARRSLYARATSALSEDFQSVPGIAARAQARTTAKIMREQVNVEDVLREAAKTLQDSKLEKEPEEDLNVDWLNAFEAEASAKSTEEMKRTFGRILAGEIERPGSFSIRAVRAVGEMGREIATEFSRLCSLTVSAGFNPEIAVQSGMPGELDTRIVTPGGNAASNGLKKYHMPYVTLQKLEQFGLINPDFNNWSEYGPYTAEIFKIEYAGKLFQLVRAEEGNSSLKLHGVSMTAIGSELRRIVDVTENVEYTADLRAYLQRHDYQLAATE